MEITWDEWAVPTITGADHEDVIYGMGVAQAQTNATAILELYGIARGRAAALWGEDFIAEDTYGAELGLDTLLEHWMAAQTPETMRRIEAFAAGFTAACEADPELGTTRRQVLPISARDVLAHCLRVFMRFSSIDIYSLAFSPEAFRGGSNGWAVSGDRSSTGGAMLMINPHLGWGGFQRWFEARTISPGRDFQGACLLGLPWQNLGYNPHVGWGHTVNAMAALTVYELEVRGDEYRYDNAWVPMQTRVHEIPVRGGTAFLVTERRSIHGPVVTAPDGAIVAVRIAGMTEQPVATALETWWQMSLAETVEQVFAVQDELPLTTFNLLAADHRGSIGAIYCGTPAKTTVTHDVLRRQRLRGDDPDALWTEVYRASSMPRVVNPAVGWVQNCNETPWFYTSPPLDPSSYPADIAPGLAEVDDMRPVASHVLLHAHRGKISPDQLLAIKFQKHSILADIALDDLLKAAEAEGDLAEAVTVLRAWDRTANADSGGYLLFALWAMLSAPHFLARTMLVPAREPGGPQRGLANPAVAVDDLRRTIALMQDRDLSLRASIGDALTFGPEQIRADGGTGFIGILKSIEMDLTPEGVGFRHGDTWMALIDFGGVGPAAGRHLLPYGNVSEPAGPPARSQHPLWAADELRPIRPPCDEKVPEEPAA